LFSRGPAHTSQQVTLRQQGDFCFSAELHLLSRTKRSGAAVSYPRPSWDCLDPGRSWGLCWEARSRFQGGGWSRGGDTCCQRERLHRPAPRRRRAAAAGCLQGAAAAARWEAAARGGYRYRDRDVTAQPTGSLRGKGVRFER